MSALSELPKAMREALACMSLFMEMGFPADVVYLKPAPAVGDERWVHVYAVVRWLDSEYSVDCGRLMQVGGDADALHEKLAAACAGALEAWNAAPITDRRAVGEVTAIWQHKVVIMGKCIAKGVVPPGWLDSEGGPT